MLITFSGLDGAGKSTLIKDLTASLEADGYSVTAITMYENLMLFAYIRGGRYLIQRAARTVLRRPRPASPALELDARGHVVAATSRTAAVVYQVTRNVLLRQCVYPIDLLIAACVVPYLRRKPNHVVLVDRYFYDSMVDIAAASSRRWFYTVADTAEIPPGRLRYIRWFLRLIPQPDAAVLVEVPAEVAYGRKPEYPMAYLAARREVYRRLFSQFVPQGSIVENEDRSAAIEKLRAITTGFRDGRRVA